MVNDIDAMLAVGDPTNPHFAEVNANRAMQSGIDYVNGGEGWNGTKNALNRYNPLLSTFEAISGKHLIEGPEFGNALTLTESAVAWANTISLAASLGAGVPGTVKAIANDLRSLSSVFVAAESTTMRNVVQFQGVEVRAVRDLSHVEQEILESMQQSGFSATTINGDRIVLHHLGQNPTGPLVEMPRPLHNIGNSVQHPLGNTAGAGLTEAQRAAHDAWRVQYWRWRATQELNARRVLDQ